MTKPSSRTVGAVVAASVMGTALHYADNAINVIDYPGPEWIHAETVYLAWSLLTLVGIAGYLFHRFGRPLASGLYLLVYSYTGLSSLAHYLFGSVSDFSPKMHLLIALDGLVGGVVLACALMILVKRRTTTATDKTGR